MASKIKLDRAGMEALLKGSEVRGAIDDMAEKVASLADGETATGDPVDVVTDSYTTDRAAAGVTLAHPAGLAIEAKRGTLARAARAAGLEVTARK